MENNTAKKAMLRNIARVGKIIEENEDVPVARYRLTEFKRKFLPILAGEVADPANAWRELTGHPFASLEVYADHSDELIYSLPSLLLRRPDVTVDDTNSESINSFMRRLEDVTMDLPDGGASISLGKLQEYFVTNDLTETRKNFQLINDILVENGYPGFLTKSLVSDSPVKADNVEIDFNDCDPI